MQDPPQAPLEHALARSRCKIRAQTRVVIAGVHGEQHGRDLQHSRGLVDPARNQARDECLLEVELVDAHMRRARHDKEPVHAVHVCLRVSAACELRQEHAKAADFCAGVKRSSRPDEDHSADECGHQARRALVQVHGQVLRAVRKRGDQGRDER